MWDAKGKRLEMTAGDYGVKIPVTVDSIAVGKDDTLRFTFKKYDGGPVILAKSFTNVNGNAVDLEFTREESARFLPGDYVWRLDWFEDGNFMCNIVQSGIFRVVRKA